MSSQRPDISTRVIHFTRGETPEAAFARLQMIIGDGKLIAGSGHVKGGYSCVCFSEAPLASLQDGLLNTERYSRYSPFGIMVSKKWLFERGGRPVIYQSDAEFHELPETHRWRHVLYEVRNGFSPSDFTWEREWRIRCDILTFNYMDATIVVPDSEWIVRLQQDHDREQDYRVMQYALMVDNDSVAELWRDEFRWRVTALKPVSS